MKKEINLAKYHRENKTKNCVGYKQFFLNVKNNIPLKEAMLPRKTKKRQSSKKYKKRYWIPERSTAKLKDAYLFYKETEANNKEGWVLRPYPKFREFLRKGYSFEDAITNKKTNLIANAKAFYLKNKTKESVWYWLYISNIHNGLPFEEAILRKKHLKWKKSTMDKYNAYRGDKTDKKTFRKRISEGLPFKEAIKRKRVSGEKRKELQEYYKKNKNEDSVTYNSFLSKVRKGMTLEEAINKKPAGRGRGKKHKDFHFYHKNKNEKSVSYGQFLKKRRKGFSLEDSIGKLSNGRRNISLPEKEKIEKNIKGKKSILLEYYDSYSGSKQPLEKYLERIRSGLYPEDAILL